MMTERCEIPKCPGKPVAAGLCDPCYSVWRRARLLSAGQIEAQIVKAELKLNRWLWMRTTALEQRKGRK